MLSRSISPASPGLSGAGSHLSSRVWTRRQLLKLGLGLSPVAYLLTQRSTLFAATAETLGTAPKPNSKFNGVQIGVIAPYSFRNLANTAEGLLSRIVEVGISAVELQNDPVERFAGAPGSNRGPGGPGGPGGIPGATVAQQGALIEMNLAVEPEVQAAGRARAALAEAVYADASALASPLAGVEAAELALARARAAAFAKLQASNDRLNPAQIEALIAQTAPPPPRGRGGPGGAPNPELTQWRAKVSMERFKELRRLYNEAGVNIYAFKLELRLNSPESDFEYAFNVCEALGANQLTMELPGDAATTRRIGEFAARRKIWAGYHAHTQAHLHAWDEAFSQSPFNGANIDIGHYVAGTSESPIPFIEKHHARITSMHLKDRKKNNGPNMPWGEGDTPIREVLQLMKKEHHTYPATIELEYNPLAGSTTLKEIARCLQFAKDALA